MAHFVSGMDTRTNLHLCILRIFQTEKKKTRRLLMYIAFSNSSQNRIKQIDV